LRFNYSRLLPAALPLFSEETEIITVPEDCAFINDDAELSNALLRKNGGKLYISGNLNIPAESAALLGQIEFLRVDGEVRLPRALMDDFGNLDAAYGNLLTFRGKLLTGKMELKLDRVMLERCADGVTVTDCVDLRLAADIPPELILAQLELNDCVNVYCSPEQHSAVAQVSEDVFNILDSDAAAGNSSGAMDRKTINATHYKL
jgi:hypothetical protein